MAEDIIKYQEGREAAIRGRKLRVLDLFSGIGGFSLGLERATMEGAEYVGFETTAFCEIEEFPRKVLAKHWPDVSCYRDVRELTAERLAADGIAVDVICGGFPCQDLSTSGTGLGLAGERSGLWSEFKRLIRDIRPSYVVLENSPELLDGWLGDVVGPLASFGYDAEWDCIPASAVGAPHRRDRIWLIAYPSGGGQSQSWGCLNTVHPASDAYREADHVVDAVQRRALPFVCGRHDGLPGGVDRLKALGNAVVPQIPELIGRAILAAQNTTIRGDKRDARKHSDWLEGYDAVRPTSTAGRE
jgi:DNA (cytosine-5)-methyltransferase 1|tara:strand:- start:2085 stop:2987 length:903 start_codon:yes stop_codon:yes gene_type:complete